MVTLHRYKVNTLSIWIALLPKKELLSVFQICYNKPYLILETEELEMKN